MQVPTETKRKSIRSPGTVVTSGGEPPNVGAENWTQVFYKSNHGAISTTPKTFIIFNNSKNL